MPGIASVAWKKVSVAWEKDCVSRFRLYPAPQQADLLLGGPVNREPQHAPFHVA
jgi:hypothetical protein